MSETHWYWYSMLAIDSQYFRYLAIVRTINFSLPNFVSLRCSSSFFTAFTTKRHEEESVVHLLPATIADNAIIRTGKIIASTRLQIGKTNTSMLVGTGAVRNRVAVVGTGEITHLRATLVGTG